MKLLSQPILVGCLVLAGCTSAPAEAPESAAPATAAPAAEATVEVPAVADTAQPTAESTVAPAGGESAAPVAGKVSANNATQEELAAAFTAAGIDNAGKWAREVAEYRPYPTDDPDFTMLREELAKYNPAPGVVDQIIAVLAP